jgi:chemotaxis protein CheD
MKPETVYLKPGEVYMDDRPALVSTILGSCVAVTMFHKSTGRGRICHAILSSNPSPGGDDTFRYVDTSIACMLKDLLSLGIPRAEIEVKVFGGARAFKRDDEGTSVGELNAGRALHVIRKERLTILASDLGGPVGRKIVFDTQSGKVLLKRLKTPDAQELSPLIGQPLMNVVRS